MASSSLKRNGHNMVKNATGKSKKNNSGFYLAFFFMLTLILIPIALFAGR